MDISIVVPIYNEGSALPPFLHLVKSWEQGAITFEVIFVDGAGNLAEGKLIQEAGHQWIRSEAGRGVQLNAGYRHSCGERLFFLHVDSYFETSPLEEIMRLAKEPSVGCFTLAFWEQERSPFYKLLAWGSNWRVRHRQIAFGDQGMFMKREVLEALGGFRNIPLMEDYDLSLRSRAAGIQLIQSEQKIFTSARRFEKNGRFKTLCRMQYYQWLFRRGVEPSQIQKYYNK